MNAIRLVRADNPGPMTLDGTNSYLVDGPAGPVVIDPGPPIPAHAAALATGGTPALILLTHRHLDHSESAAALAADWDCPVRAADASLCVGADPLTDGEEIAVGAVPLTVVATPGHTDDSICLLAGGEAPVVLTGDTVLGRGTTVITRPDGELGAYLRSLDRLLALVAEESVAALLPGHGPVLDDPVAVLEQYRTHRLERLDQVRAALAEGASTAEEVVDRVYLGLDPRVRPAALQTVRAQLAFLGLSD